MQGREAIQASYAQAFEMGMTVAEFTMTPVSIDGVDGLVYDHSTWLWTGTFPGSTDTVTERGKSLAIARRQDDGSWRWIAATWNSDAPPPGQQ